MKRKKPKRSDSYMYFILPLLTIGLFFIFVFLPEITEEMSEGRSLSSLKDDLFMEGQPISPAPNGVLTGHFQKQATCTAVLGSKINTLPAQGAAPDIALTCDGSCVSSTSPKSVPKTTPKAAPAPIQPPKAVAAANTSSSVSATATNQISTSTLASVPKKASTLVSNFGFSMGENLSWISPENLGAILDQFAALGVDWIRIDFSWASIQHDGSETYDWDALDRIVDGANSRNIKVLPILTYTPSWARRSDCAESFACAPENPEQFGVFSGEAVKRYAPLGIHTWEIWNEPNVIGFWKPYPSATNYEKLLAAAYESIKSQDPTATVISGGLAPAETADGAIAPTDFLLRLYEAGGRQYFDAVGMHPYTYPFLVTDDNPWSAWLQMGKTAPNLRSIMARYGDSDKRIWLTEYGAPTDGPGLGATEDNFYRGRQVDHVSEGLQADALSAAITEYNKLSWAGPIFWYSYQDLGTTEDTNENFFGLLRFDGSEKPAYDILKQLLSE